MSTKALGGANPMDLVMEGDSRFLGTTVSGESFEGSKISDIAEGNWFSEADDHGKGSPAVRNAWLKSDAGKGMSLSNEAGIMKFYNDDRIPTYNKLMDVILRFGADTGGDANSQAARELRQKSGESREAWYRRQAVFWATQINNLVGEKKGADQKKGSRTGTYMKDNFGEGLNFGPAGEGTRPLVDSDTVKNPYSMTERGNASALHTIINAALSEGLYAEEADGLEKASLEDISFVLHHMGSVGAEYGKQFMYDELLKEGFELNEYGEIMAFSDGQNDYTLAINFKMDKDGKFSPLSKNDVGIITRTQFDIYTEAWANLPQAARAEALELAVISKTMGSINDFFLMETARARTIQDAYRFTCKADAAIPAILDELMENFLLLADSEAAKQIGYLKKHMKGIGES